MQNILLKNHILRLLMTLFFCYALTGCDSKKNVSPPVIPAAQIPPAAESKPTATSTEVSANSAPVSANQTAPTAIETPSENKTPEVKTNWLAQLTEKVRNVDFRLRKESLWQDASVGSTFEKFDALQTKDDSQAKVVYQSGSRLEIKSNTLVIFDHDPGINHKKNVDRVIVKNGELVGTTQSELWILTNAGLVQVKTNEKKAKSAQAKISIRDGKKLNIKVNSGQAELVYQKNDTYQKVQIAAKSEIEVESSQALPTSPVLTDEKAIEKLTTSLSQTQKVVKAELVIDSPKSETTTEKSFEVSGRLTDLGGKLIINGELIDLNEQLQFSKKIELTEGTNLIVFQLIRSDGTVQFARKTLKLNRAQ